MDDYYYIFGIVVQMNQCYRQVTLPPIGPSRVMFFLGAAKCNDIMTKSYVVTLKDNDGLIECQFVYKPKSNNLADVGIIEYLGKYYTCIDTTVGIEEVNHIFKETAVYSINLPYK